MVVLDSGLSGRTGSSATDCCLVDSGVINDGICEVGRFIVYGVFKVGIL